METFTKFILEHSKDNMTLNEEMAASLLDLEIAVRPKIKPLGSSSIH